MVRKTKEETQETYQALLDAAEREFRNRGVTRTTLADVASAAGMTRGAIYWHFKNKDDLFKAMCDRAFLPMEALLNQLSQAPGEDPLGDLRHLMHKMLYMVSHDTRQRTVFEIMFHRCEKTAEMQFFEQEIEQRNECLRQVEAIMRAAVQRGQLPADTHTWIAVQAMHGYLMGLIHEWVQAPASYDLAEYAGALIDLFLAGLAARPPRTLLQQTAGAT